MTMISNSRHPSISSQPGLIMRAVTALRLWNDRRRLKAQLSALSDAMLRDIGLTRGQIHEAVRYSDEC